MKQKLKNYLKNITGWRTNRKLLVFSVDDYGNVRVDSPEARSRLDQAGIQIHSRFDQYDTLETREDLDLLYEALSSVKDQNGRNAVFTPFALPCNINFEAMEVDDYQSYVYESLPETFTKLKDRDPRAYAGAWSLWKEGIERGLMRPQFHGREHFNLKVFEEKLANRDRELLAVLKTRSFTSITSTGYSTIGYTGAFQFWNFRENERFRGIIEDGLGQFSKVFGYQSTHFNAPGGREHRSIHHFLAHNGILYIDQPFIGMEHQGFGKYKRSMAYTGKRHKTGIVYMVRNVVFEPSVPGTPWVANALAQIEAAFSLRRPAIISSHRVNYCGHIEPENRAVGIASLKSLLKEIVRRWPDVEFMSSEEVGRLVREGS